jgi:hypothetical protein
VLSGLLMPIAHQKAQVKKQLSDKIIMSFSTYFGRDICIKPLENCRMKNGQYSVCTSRPPKAESPYYPDREVAQKNKIQGSSEETKWKEVPSYHKEHSQVIDTNLKKINII